MGVPKFFRYTSERYPCLNELVKQYQIPDFDNMYLDMNGIIHNCSHPDDSNPHFRITEEKIFQDIFHYISILFQIIKPKKLFFMAIDGVAPRAKMNQQRGRRFRSAREAEKLEEDAKAKGEVLPSEKRFDSNCITPGTVFMARLHEQLRYFVKEKMTTDPLWAKVKVVLSGHETPGEGEHKIMDYIRWMRSQPDYDPNTRHCLYGLDADLIMLGMCTHEPHFALLREEVKFGKTTQRSTSPEETNFYLLHLSLLRQYLEQEFIAIKDNLPFEYDLEKIVDDWVLMGFLVGNDFIPNLPNMHISNDALPLLYKTYMTVLPTLDGYINEAGDLNLARFEIFMQELAKIDKESFQDVYADLKYFEGKTGRRPNAQERKQYKPNNDDTFNVDINEIKAKPDDDLQALINATEDMFLDDDMENNDDYEETSDEEGTFELEFLLHKKDYYMNKLDYSKVTEEVLADQAEGYVRAIQWNLFYYYKGCPSWCWYYPHHYAPYISDIKGFKDLKIEFELGEPFKPFEQLLAVLPSASKQLLPTPFHSLMTDEDSPIVHYYPMHFETDLNGKKNDWEAVVLIPFIDETNLLSAMSPCYQRLTEEELKRNSHGPMMVYNWTAESQGPILAPQYFNPIKDCHAVETPVFREQLEVPEHQLKRGMLPNAMRDMIFPGFPTMKHLKYESNLKKCKVKVFDMPSRNENMMVRILRDDQHDPELEAAAQELLGKTIWVGWPHLSKAKVISISNENMRLHYCGRDHDESGGNVTMSMETNSGNLHKQWLSERSTIIEHNMNRLGIELGDVNIIVHAVNHKGYKYIVHDNKKMVLEPEWCSVPCGYAYQTIVKDVQAHVIQEAGKYATPEEAYPPGDHVFLLSQGPHYGALAKIVDSKGVYSGRVKVQVTEVEEPTPVAHSMPSMYRTVNHAAAACGISSQMLSRITGTVFVVSGERNNLPTETQDKVNVGLNLKFNKKNQEVTGYTRRCKRTNSWLYSERCIDLVKAYAHQFPELFDKLSCTMNNDVFFEGDLWPNEIGEKKHKDVMQWIKSQPHSKAARRECGSDALEPAEMKALAASVDKQRELYDGKGKATTLSVKWKDLYKPELHEGNISPDPQANFEMYDRVVCVARNITVPLGSKGTITAVYEPPTSNTVRLSDKLNATPTYQVMFDEPFPGAVVEELFDEPRFYRMSPNNMLNISYGRKLRKAAKAGNVSEPFSFSRTPTILRREDGHHSAFASYSPTSDNKIPIENKNVANTSNHLQSQKTPEDNHNWRNKNDSNVVPQAPAIRPPQQQNWRVEKTNRSQQQTYSNEWTNKNFKNQPPLLPNPTFGHAYPMPGLSQIPFPQFQMPRFQPRSHSNQGFGYHGNQHHQPPRSFPPSQGFPPHLPNVNGAGFTRGQNQKPVQNHNYQNTMGPAHAGSERVNPPFVPLQVQTSQRRIQNPSGPSTRRDMSNLAAPKPVLPETQQYGQDYGQYGQDLAMQNQSETSKRLRKKKSRIAANLPFQMD